MHVFSNRMYLGRVTWFYNVEASIEFMRIILTAPGRTYIKHAYYFAEDIRCNLLRCYRNTR